MSAPARIASVLAVYVVLGVVVLGGGLWLGRVLILPPLFTRLLVGMVALGVPVAVAVAWRYPDIGGREADPGSRSADAGPGVRGGREGA